MKKTLFKKIFKSQLLSLCICALVLFFFQLLMVWLYPNFKDSISMMFEGLPPFFRSMMGGEHLSFAALPGYLTMGIVHPLVLLLFALYPLRIAISSIAGEISQRTGDLLFTKPMCRYSIIMTSFFILLLGAFILAFSVFLGLEVGFLLVGLEVTIQRIYLFRASLVIFAMILAIGGLAFFFSVITRNSSRATALCGGLILFMYVLDFLIPFWEALESFSPLFFFHYFNPGDVLAGEGIWLLDSLVLLGIGILFTVLAMIIVERVDL